MTIKTYYNVKLYIPPSYTPPVATPSVPKTGSSFVFENKFFNGISFYCNKIFNYFFLKINCSSIDNALPLSTVKKNYLHAGEENKWKEFVDSRFHHLGREVFDKGLHIKERTEPGFAGSAESAVSFVGQSLNVKVNAAWFRRLHSHLCAHFKGKETNTLMGQEKVGVFKNLEDIESDFTNVSYQALSELKTLNDDIARQFGESYRFAEAVAIDSTKTKIKYKPIPAFKIQIIFNKFLADYYEEIKSSEDKVLAIARLYQRLEWLHPFRDGTTRSCVALLNKNLAENGFRTVTLNETRICNCLRLADWKNHLKAEIDKQ